MVSEGMPPTWSRCTWSRAFLRLQNRLLVSTSCRHYKGAATWNCGCVYPAEFGSGTTFSFLDRFGKVLAELWYDLPSCGLGESFNTRDAGDAGM